MAGNEQDYREAIYPLEGYCTLFIKCHICLMVKTTTPHFIKRTNTGRLVLKKSCTVCRENIKQEKINALISRVESSDINPNIRRCKKCGQVKPITNFPSRRTNKQGLKLRGNTCRSCSTQGGGTGMTKEKKLKVLKRDNYKCHYCGNYGDTVDHIIPMSKGGRNGMKNLVCACYDCNQERRDMDYEEFVELKRRSKLSKLYERFEGNEHRLNIMLPKWIN